MDEIDNILTGKERERKKQEDTIEQRKSKELNQIIYLFIYVINL